MIYVYKNLSFVKKSESLNVLHLGHMTHLKS